MEFEWTSAGDNDWYAHYKGMALIIFTANNSLYGQVSAPGEAIAAYRVLSIDSSSVNVLKRQCEAAARGHVGE